MNYSPRISPLQEEPITAEKALIHAESHFSQENELRTLSLTRFVTAVGKDRLSRVIRHPSLHDRDTV